MTENAAVSGDPPSESSTTRLIGFIMQKRPRLGALLRLTAVPLWFDEGLLAALRGKDDGLEGEILSAINEFSFVHASDGRFRYSPEMRRLLLLQWKADWAGFKEAHHRALAYFEAQLAEAHPLNPVAYEELTQARLFHLLIADEEAGLQLLQRLFRRARDEHRLAAAERYVDMAEIHTPFLSARGHAYLEYMRSRVDQLHWHWDKAQACLQRLLSRADLPPDLVPLVKRASARSLVEQRRWDEGIPLYEEALIGFREAADALETALTAARLGEAYLTLAISVWGSGWLPQTPPPSRFRILFDLGNLVARFPLVIFLMLRLGFRTMLPVAHRVGYNMDWIVGGLLGTAAQWLHRAEAMLMQVDSPAGLIRVWENQAHLYRLLNHPRQAEAINSRILDTPGIELDEYRAARARLGMAHALMLRNQPQQAKPFLNQVLPVFVRAGHRRRTAQTQTLWARAQASLGEPDQALAWYQNALVTWQGIGDQASVTDVVHEMEAFQNAPKLTIQSSAAISQATEQVKERCYPVRYSHPVLSSFQRGALIIFAIVCFFSLRFALQTEWGIAVSATPTLIQPIHRTIPFEEELRPSLVLTVEQQLRPELETRFIVLAIVGAFAVYLVAYSLVGLCLILRMPLHTVQSGWLQQVRTDPDGIGGVDLEEARERVAWDEITSLLISDRILRQRPLTTISFTALFSKKTRVVVSAFTRHYEALQTRVKAQLGDGVPLHDLGFNVLHSPSGWLLLASLSYLLLFALLSQVAPDLLTSYLDSIPYSLSDLYGLAYLGVAFPLGWWFAVQPLRARLLVSPRSPLVWWVGGVGIALTAFCLLQVALWRFPLGRPDVAVSALSILLILVASLHVIRARTPGPGGANVSLYALPVRTLVLLLAIVALAAALAAIAWELVSFHSLALGNYQWRRAETLQRLGEHEQAQQLYGNALEAYDRSLELRPEAAIYNSRGAILAHLGRHTEAMRSYERAFEIRPEEWAYVSNMALAYTNMVTETDCATLRADRYKKALEKHDQAIAGMETDPKRYGRQLIAARLLRAAVYYDLGQIYEDDQRPHDVDFSQDCYWHALEDYQWVILHDRREAAAHTGRGWALFRLRALAGQNLEAERSVLHLALSDFEQALERNSQDVSASAGLGWTHFYLAMTYPDCEDADDPPGSPQQEEHLESAVQAYSTTVRLESDAAIHYRVRAQLQWLLRYCDHHDLGQQLELARDDYDCALARNPERAAWYYVRAHLYYGLAAKVYKDDADRVQEARRRALADFERAATLELGNAERWIKFADVAYEWRDYAKAAMAYQRAGELRPENGRLFWRQGWAAYMIDDYARSLEASAQALRLLPQEPIIYFNQGLAYVAIGDPVSALKSYLAGSKAAEQIADQQKRIAKYRVGIADLRAARADPQGVVPAFLRLLRAAEAGCLVSMCARSRGVAACGCTPIQERATIGLLRCWRRILPSRRLPTAPTEHGYVCRSRGRTCRAG